MKELIIGVIALFVIGSTAQDYRFKKVDDIDFERLTPQNKEEADAEMLYRKEHISFRYIQGKGLIQVKSVQERIKINNEQGISYATKNIRLYNESSSRREKLKNLNGFTYSKKEGKIESVKLRNNGEFEEDINEYWKLSSFTMPDVRVGSIIEYEYDIESPFLAIDDINLQYPIPLRKIDVKVEMIEYFTYNVFFNPKASFVPSLESLVASDKITTSSTSNDETFETTKMDVSSKRYQLNNQILKIETNDIPALESEPMSGDISNYRSKIVFELAEIRYPSEPVKYLSVNWESVSKTIYESDMFGDQLEIKPFYKEELEKALTGAVDDKDKIVKIYNFVKSKVKWNGFYGRLADEGIKDAYENGSGNVADINLLLTSMLRSQNIEAYPLLISTKDNGIPLFPTRDGFNYVAVVAKNNGELIKLDGTNSNLGLDQLPLQALNWEGRVIEKDGKSYALSLYPNYNSSEITLLNVKLKDESKLTGKSVKRLTNYRALDFRINYGNRVEEDIIEHFKSGTLGVEIESLEVKNLKALNQPVDVSYNVTFNNYAEQIGDKIFINPLMNEGNAENPFKLSERKLPIVFDFPVSSKIIVNLDIPEGYAVESLPESVKINYNKDIGYYQYVVSMNNNRINIATDFNMSESEIHPRDYQTWKDFFTAVVAKDAEKIVLKKI